MKSSIRDKAEGAFHEAQGKAKEIAGQVKKILGKQRERRTIPAAKGLSEKDDKRKTKPKVQ